jgi:hypothetical protein
MNANELAEYIQEAMPEAATMLRQQQAEIEALKQIIDANNLNQNIGQFVKPAKTLTDEEIKDIWMKRPVGKAEDIFIFARAILRKAQEK